MHENDHAQRLLAMAAEEDSHAEFVRGAASHAASFDVAQEHTKRAEALRAGAEALREPTEAEVERMAKAAAGEWYSAPRATAREIWMGVVRAVLTTQRAK